METKSLSSVRIFYPRLSKKQVIQELNRGVEALAKELPLSLVCLFGSYARGNYTVASDIDLLVVYRGERREDAYVTVRRAFDLPNLEPHVYSAEEYQEMKDILSRMLKDSVVIHQAG
jgi:predicted nucleotidyltransferase